MNPQIKKRVIRTLVIVAIGLIVGALLGLQEIANTPHPTQAVAGVKVGGPFSLVNQDGQTVTQDTYKGQYKLIYFGFTYCPAVCPTELQKMTRALNALGPAAEKVQPIFITVDPERDTVPVMKQYVSLYHPRLVGLTGTPGEIAKTLKNYKIYAAKVQEEGMSDYTMDHSSFIYFLDGEDNLLGLYRAEDGSDKIAADLRKVLDAAPQQE